MNDAVFKVGDKVRVMRRSLPGEVYWAFVMDRSIGKIFRVIEVSRGGNLLLDDGYYYPVGGVIKVNVKNAQLVFDFMLEKG